MLFVHNLSECDHPMTIRGTNQPLSTITYIDACLSLPQIKFFFFSFYRASKPTSFGRVSQLSSREVTCQESNVGGCVAFMIGWTNLMSGNAQLISLALIANMTGQGSPSRFVPRISLVPTLCFLYKSCRNPWCLCHASYQAGSDVLSRIHMFSPRSTNTSSRTIWE